MRRCVEATFEKKAACEMSSGELSFPVQGSAVSLGFRVIQFIHRRSGGSVCVGRAVGGMDWDSEGGLGGFLWRGPMVPLSMLHLQSAARTFHSLQDFLWAWEGAEGWTPDFPSLVGFPVPGSITLSPRTLFFYYALLIFHF